VNRQGRAAFFKLSGQVLAVDSTALRQVVTVTQLTPVPRSSASLLGLFAERGNIFPLLDLHPLLGLELLQNRNTDLALLLQSQDVSFALSIDEMLGFFPYEDKQTAKNTLHGFAEAEINYQNHDATLLNINYIAASFQERVA
jgi:chemotaxis signal transduction protein